MDNISRNVFDYKKINQINSNTKRHLKNKELIQKIQKQNNLKHSKLINFILFEIILIILPKTNKLSEFMIKIQVNKPGKNQILSDKYIGDLPSITINNNPSNINTNDKTINVGTINDIILLKWNSSISNIFNISHMFENLETITHIYMNYIPEENIKVKNINITNINITNNNNNLLNDTLTNNTNVTDDETVSIDYYYPTDLSYTFYNCSSLTNLEFIYFKTDYVEEISYMFFNCTKLENLSFTDCIFSNNLTTNMRGMFQNCESITSLDLSSFYTPQVEIMWDMFKDCKLLNSLILSNFDTSKVTDMESMFEGCKNLTSLNLTHFRTPKVYYMNKMFLNCSNLQYINLNYSTSESLGTMTRMFYNCKNLKYLNLFSLTELALKPQTTSEIFKGASNDFTFCIYDYKNIPNLFKEIYNISNTKPDCTEVCYGEGNKKHYIIHEKICCLYFLYNNTCYDKCPPKTVSNDNKICVPFSCEYWYNYTQDGCLDSDVIPDGYFPNDTESKTIDKCHDNCKTCIRGPTKSKNYCSNCNENYPYLYLDNCVSSCPHQIYFDDLGIKKCKCEIEECLECSEESLNVGLCLTCETGYHPKSDDIYNYTKCYKDPPKYYFDINNNIYKPCYPSCEKCYGDGNDDFHNCIICDSNHTFTIKNLINNCYESCTYYYYFYNNNKYNCTEKAECPNNYKYLIVELGQCVSSCSVTDYKTKFSYGCYKECPLNISVPREGVPNSCRPLCTYEFPFELVLEEKCVARCSIMERSQKLCITNYFGNRTNLEIQELIHVDIKLDLENEFDYTIINENQTVFIEENKTNYEIVTTRNNNPNSNTSRINLGKCEDVLKEYYSIPQDEYLYMLVIDAYVEEKKGPVTLYEVYYPLFNSKTLFKLDLSICKGLKINVFYNMNLDNPEMYNKNNIIYNDICHPYSSKDGVDMTISDLRSEYKDNNRSICDEGCDYSEYVDGFVKCDCDIKESVRKMPEVKIDKNKLYKFVNIKNIANFGVLKCLNLLLDKKRMITNIGIYSFIPTFIAYIICLILFYKRDFTIIKEHIKDILFAIENLKYLNAKIKIHKQNQINLRDPAILIILKAKKIINKDKEINVIKNISLNKNDSSIQLKKNFILEKKTEESNSSETIYDQEIYSNNDAEMDSKSKINIKNNIGIIRKNIKKSTLKNSNSLNNKIVNKKQSGFKYESYNEDFARVQLNKQLTEKELERIIQILCFNEKELNELNFIKAIKYDKRTFIQIYYSFLKMEHILIKIFNSTDYNSLVIKIYLLFYNFSLTYTVNALFFNEGTMHQILEDEGKFNFLYQIPQILYSSIISYFFGMILENLALTEDDILNFKTLRVANIALKKAKKLIIVFWVKFFYFFFLSFLFLLLFWYYVTCFCVVYKNTQYHLIKDTLIGFVTGLLTPLGTKLIPAFFRLYGLKKTNKYLFLLSKILQIFL